jgi:hypothetical protein
MILDSLKILTSNFKSTTMKKIITILGLVAVAAVILVSLSSFTSKDNSVEPTPTHVHVSAEGKYCKATVGCDCRGFSPITDGKEWQKNYCKRCGHHKNYHK